MFQSIGVTVMHKWFALPALLLVSTLSIGPVTASDNESFFEAIVPDNASVSAVKDSGGKVLDAGEEVLENIVDDGKTLGSFLLKKAGDIVDGTAETVKGLAE